MKIGELIVNGLMRTAIFEMAYDRRRAKDKVTDLSPLIFDHLLKLWVLEYPRGRNHWLSELDSWLLTIDKIYLKPNKNKLSKNDLYNWLLLDAAPHYSEEYIDHTVNQWKRTEYSKIPVRDYNATVVLNQITGIITHICSDISSGKFITIKDYL